MLIINRPTAALSHLLVFFLLFSRFGHLTASLTHLHVAMGSSDDVNALPILFVFQDAGVVFGRQDEQQVLTLALKTRQRESKISEGTKFLFYFIWKQ